MEERTPSNPPVIPPVSEELYRPFWSVMIPAYNCISYLQTAIESVLAQDPGAENMQIEVIDDYSTDGDVERLVKDVGKGRVAFFKQPANRGSLRNFETCIKRSRGYYVHILHGDDFIYPGFYDQIGGLLKQFPEAGAAFSNYYFVDDEDRILDIDNPCLMTKQGIIPDFLDKIGARQLIQPPAIVVKRSTYETLGSFYAVHFGEDWEMWARIASKFPVAYTPDFLAAYRVAHGIGISHNWILTGQNLIDIEKVINIIQTYIPANKQKKLRKMALTHNAIYSIKLANGMLVNNRQGALVQAKGALKLSKSWWALYWGIRFYLMYIFRFKQVQARYKTIKNRADLKTNLI